MSAYTGAGKSNFVDVKNPKLFEELLRAIGCRMIYRADAGYGFIAENPKGEPNLHVNVEQLDAEGNVVKTHSKILWTKAISEHLMPGSVLIFQHVGRSGYDEFRAYSVAVSWTGSVDVIDINDIFPKIAKKYAV